MFTSIMLIVFGSALLAWGADRFVTGALVIARQLGVPSLVIGIVLVGFATSLPEMIVSAMASFHGSPVLAIGNAVGSNIINVCLAIGIATLIAPITTRSNLLKREFPVLMGVILVVFLLLADGFLSRLDGVLMSVLFLLLIGYMIYQAKTHRAQRDAMAKEAEEMIPEAMSTKMALFWWLFGLVLLLVSSRMLVIGAVAIAQHFGVSDLVIGLTVVALGTSLPEIAAAVASALKNEPDIAIGNVIGSNIFNLLPVMIMPALIAPTAVPPHLLTRDFSLMMVMNILLMVFAVGIKGRGKIYRLEGLLFVLIYCVYTALLILGVI